jgi:hypothetical protein
MREKQYLAETYYELLETDGAEILGKYTEGFASGKAAVTKNGNVIYVGFYTVKSAELYADIISEYLDTDAPIDPDVERFALGEYYLYLNHSDRCVALSGYDEISAGTIDSLAPYGVALIKKK